MAASEVMEFNGVKFRRYPESKHRSDRVYFTPGPADKMKGHGRLHEEVWKAANGPIPAGHHVHHVDGNPLNNDPTNLEAKAAGDHIRGHLSGTCSPEQRELLKRIRPLASAWHASPAGIEWHRQNGKKLMAAREPVQLVCDQCGSGFQNIQSFARFCSNNCKSQWRRDSGVDDEQRACAVCGADFTINRYAKAKVCSKPCQNKQHSQAMRAKTSPPSGG